ncbi:CPBP family intramembrane glutamic endopeptidase [Chloroflexota bacterium]
MRHLLDPHNHLFELARSGKRLPHLIVAIILSVVFILVAGIGGGIVAVVIVSALSIITGEISTETLTQLSQAQNNEALTQLLLPTTALEQTIFLVLAFGPIFLLLWGWLALFEKRPLWTVGLEWSGAVQKYLRGLLVGLLMFVVSIGISAAFGYIAIEEGSSQPQGWTALGGVLLVFLGWTVQGPAEEVLNRGWLLPVIGARYKPWLGILISSVIFTVFHALNPNLGPIAILNLFLFGVFAAFYALYEGGLWGIFSIHAAWNWAQGNVFGFEVSGGIAPGGTLFDLMEIGPDVVTGGPFGPEGGLAVTVVLVVSCVIVWILSKRKANLQLDG